MSSNLGRLAKWKYLAQGVALAAAFALPSVAKATTAAGTIITNTATLNYSDGGGVAQGALTSSVTVTVNLVEAAATVSSPANPATIQQGAGVTLTYNLVSNANGSDTYTPSLTGDVLSNIAAFSGGAFTPATAITLGGTTLAVAAVAGNGTIQVPCDGTGTAGSTTNGFDTVTNNHIVIGAFTYTITGINRGACGTANSNVVITLGSNISGATVNANTQVGESLTAAFTFSFTHAGTVTSPTTAGTYTLTTSVQSGGAGPLGAQATPTVVTVDGPLITITKYTSTTGASGSWTTANTNANPGATVFYLILIANTGLGNATAASITDTIAAYLTYTGGSCRYATVNLATVAYTTGTAIADGSNGQTFVSPLLTYTPGAFTPTGTVAAGGFLDLMYKVSID